MSIEADPQEALAYIIQAHPDVWAEAQLAALGIMEQRAAARAAEITAEIDRRGGPPHGLPATPGNG